MGSCFSHGGAATTESVRSPAARIIAVDGSLQLVLTPATAADALPAGSSSILCSSDALYYDAFIPHLDFADELVAGQIYFVLPATMLGRPLTWTDMADLAVKASCAIASAVNRSSERKNGRKIKARVMPVVVDGVDNGEIEGIRRFNEASLGGGDGLGLKIRERREELGKWRRMGRSLSARMRSGRLGSRRSYRLRLSTIDEVEE